MQLYNCLNLIILISFLFNVQNIDCNSNSSMATTTNQTNPMIKNGVVPDVIDVVPQAVIDIKFPNGTEVKMGHELTPTQVKDHPSNISWPTTPGSYYTLCMSDPDASTREMLHWLVVNIPAGSPPDISKGKVLAEYIGSGTPKGTGKHRYIFLAYKQPGLIQPDEKMITNRSREGRRNFKIRNFAKKYNLGQSIAGNFFLAQYDDYVPILHAQMSG